MKVTSDFLKAIAPFITFVLGVFAAPLVESLKDKRKAKKVKKNFILEIEDEIKTLIKNLKNMATALQDSKKLINGNPSQGDVVRCVPRITYIYFIGQTMDFSFGEFSEKQRNAMKSFLVQIEAMNDYINIILNTKITSETVAQLMDNYKRYLYTGSCMLNTMRIIINNENLNSSENDHDIIKGVFGELKIELSIEDLAIKRTMNIPKY
ncbi:hypothetical protein I5L21_11935 [Serratia liquefaciens]|uniref:hypothetical protein n=1 Tax=Serratia liquefaciens TaxID=614 RepID=UPI0018D99DD7|nr:hypothetical protein [Serratia liquefaciens]MBH2811298.1 hypothetical protein [Serratia liquefaciens]CAI2411640.1 Uncharacterised protein [Serratia liquefaciens]